MATSAEILRAMAAASAIIVAVGGDAEWNVEDKPFTLETNVCADENGECYFGASGDFYDVWINDEEEE